MLVSVAVAPWLVIAVAHGEAPGRVAVAGFAIGVYWAARLVSAGVVS